MHTTTEALITQSDRPTRRNAPRPRSRRLNSSVLFVVPALVIVGGIIYLGVGYNLWVSALDWDGISEAEFVGLDNYAQVLSEPVFWQSIVNVLIFGVATVVIQMILGLLMAIVLSGPVIGRSVYKVIMFLPVVLAPAAVATAFRQIFSPDGAFNAFLASIGLDGIASAWIADPKTALWVIIVANIWQWTGFSFILYQAAITQIDHDQLEAAQLDGAGRLRTIRSIIVPQLKGTHITLAITGVIGAFKTFDLVWLITGGGPGRSTEFLTTYIYKEAIQQFHTGYASALSIVLLVIAVIFTAIQMRVFRFGKD